MRIAYCEEIHTYGMERGGGNQWAGAWNGRGQQRAHFAGLAEGCLDRGDDNLHLRKKGSHLGS